MTNDDHWILKYKSAGMPDKDIARKMGMTEAALAARWEIIQQEMKAAVSDEAGALAFNNQFYVLCQQFQLIGESLKVIAGAIGNEADMGEIQKVIEECKTPATAAFAIKQKFIVLRAFVPVDPAVQLEQDLKRTAETN